MPGNFIRPNWLAPDNVRAISTVRTGGVSTGVYESLNLGTHVGDDIKCVKANRAEIPCPSSQLWLEQVHGTEILYFGADEVPTNVADGSYTQEKHHTCIVMTADCLPVLLTDTQGSFVAALHCGWRGLADGLIEQALNTINSEFEIIAWLGPAIGPDAFEVGTDVFAAFPEQQSAFRNLSSGKFLADIFAIATMKLNALGVTQVCSSQLCTFSNPEQFFSYRRDGQTGRMATLIWLE